MPCDGRPCIACLLRIAEQRYRTLVIERVCASLDCIPGLSYALIGAYAMMHQIPESLAAAIGLSPSYGWAVSLMGDHEHNHAYSGSVPGPHRVSTGQRRRDDRQAVGSAAQALAAPRPRRPYCRRATSRPSQETANLRRRDIHVYRGGRMSGTGFSTRYRVGR